MARKDKPKISDKPTIRTIYLSKGLDDTLRALAFYKKVGENELVRQYLDEAVQKEIQASATIKDFLRGEVRE